MFILCCQILNDKLSISYCYWQHFMSGFLQEKMTFIVMMCPCCFLCLKCIVFHFVHWADWMKKQTKRRTWLLLWTWGFSMDMRESTGHIKASIGHMRASTARGKDIWGSPEWTWLASWRGNGEGRVRSQRLRGQKAKIPVARRGGLYRDQRSWENGN